MDVPAIAEMSDVGVGGKIASLTEASENWMEPVAGTEIIPVSDCTSCEVDMYDWLGTTAVGGASDEKSTSWLDTEDVGGTSDVNVRSDDGVWIGTSVGGTADENKKADVTDWLATLAVDRASPGCERDYVENTPTLRVVSGTTESKDTPETIW